MDQAIGLSSVVYRQKNVNRLKRVKVTGVVRYVTAFQLVGGHIQGSKSTLGYKSWKKNKLHRYFHAIWRTLGLTYQLTNWLANVRMTWNTIVDTARVAGAKRGGERAKSAKGREKGRESLTLSPQSPPPFFFPSSQSPNPALSTPATRARSSIAFFFFSFQALRW